MNKLAKLYIDFINWLDPYWECHEEPENVLEIELPEMLYNLLAIKEDWSEIEPELAEVLDATISQFKAAGIEII